MNQLISQSIYTLLYYYVFQLLEKKLVKLVKKEMKRFRKVLKTTGYPECLESQEEEGEEERRSITEGALKITLTLLRSLKLEELADLLMMSKKHYLYL